MQLLGRRARSAGTIYFTGGASAVLRGWREMTLDVDLKLDPEPDGVFGAIQEAKEELGINIELAAPDDFIPPLPGWRERSEFIDRVGLLDFRHYDFYAQALAKIERGHTQDLKDVAAMFTHKLVDPRRLREYFAAVVPDVERYPAIDLATFREKLATALARCAAAEDQDAD